MTLQWSDGPSAQPLLTVQELLAWTPTSQPASELCRAAVPLPRQVTRSPGPACGRPPARPPARPCTHPPTPTPSPPPLQGRRRPPGPRLLACHDMAGGYAEDRWVQGGGDATYYHLRHWRCLDAFVYFSHRLGEDSAPAHTTTTCWSCSPGLRTDDISLLYVLSVTIPPPGWVNAAHTHGVPVLGTLITEWTEGESHCARLFGDAASAVAAAAALATVAAHHGFEGWLINIENKLPMEHIPHLLTFLRWVGGSVGGLHLQHSTLHSCRAGRTARPPPTHLPHLPRRRRELSAAMAAVARAREANGGGGGWWPHRVIWYDAVTVEGRLEWQNTLNALNRPFLDAADAIWVNYTWTEATPEAARREVRVSAAGGRGGQRRWRRGG